MLASNPHSAGRRLLAFLCPLFNPSQRQRPSFADFECPLYALFPAQHGKHTCVAIAKQLCNLRQRQKRGSVRRHGAHFSKGWRCSDRGYCNFFCISSAFFLHSTADVFLPPGAYLLTVSRAEMSSVPFPESSLTISPLLPRNFSARALIFWFSKFL